jgi:DNA-binding response OmpR family regulator
MSRAVLVVDDDPSVKKLLSLFLKEHFFKAISANYDVAVETLNDNKNAIDAIIVNGDPRHYETILCIQEKLNKIKPGIPIIILSSLFEETAPELKILRDRGSKILVTLTYFLQDILEILACSIPCETIS